MLAQTLTSAVVGLDDLPVAAVQEARERIQSAMRDSGLNAGERLPGTECQMDLRRIEDATYGLRWLEVVHGLRFDLGHSLVRQIPLALLSDDLDGGGDRAVCVLMPK